MLASMTMARWIILFSVIGAGVMGYLGWKLHQERIELEAALVADVPALAQDLLVQASKHSQLYKEFENTGSGPQDNLKSYIVRRASREHVALGNVILTNKDEPIRGAVDKKITIKPQFADKGAQRLQVANFLYYLEQDSRRLYVTSVHLEPEERKLKVHEVAKSDRWVWDAEVTVREKVDE